MDRRTVIRGLAAIAAAVAVGDAVLLRRGGAGDAAGAGRAPTGSPPRGGRPRVPVGRDPGTPMEPRPAQPARPSEREAATGPAVEPAALPVVCPRDWGAQPPRPGFRSHELGLLTVHHTEVVHRDPGEGPARVRGHQRHHLGSGFADLAYHFVVDAGGVVYEGRPVDAVGETFTEYDPTGHFLPCLEGDFGRHEPTLAQVAALVDLLAWAAGTFGVDPATIAGHRAYAATACPGDHLQRLVDDGTLRRGVEDRLAGGGVRLERSC